VPKTILLIGTLDTKGAEYAYVRDLIIERGHRVLVLDAGIMGEPPFNPDIPAEVVAQAGGSSLAALRQQADRGTAVEMMAYGAAQLTFQLYAKGKFDGVLGLGGAGGTAIATAAMRALPLGLPKVMVSTLACGDTQPYVGVKDINMMYSVVDIAGINRLSRRIFVNAVGSVCGMVEQKIPVAEKKPLLAATMFGVTTPCVDALRKHLEQAGYEMVVFHATGRGGQTMENLIKDGEISGVADVTTSEWCDELVGGVMSAGPHRLEGAGQAGIPQVVSCGALDIVDFYHTVPAKFKDRTFHKHNANITLMRTNPEECAELGQIIAGKLNRAKGPTALFVPLQGLSAIDKKGQPFYLPEANEALFEALRHNIRPPVELVELDLHINDPEFAIAMANRLLEMLTIQKM
jgi:uncharacterized protein (UPF0261 family)